MLSDPEPKTSADKKHLAGIQQRLRKRVETTKDESSACLPATDAVGCIAIEPTPPSQVSRQESLVGNEMKTALIQGLIESIQC